MKIIFLGAKVSIFSARSKQLPLSGIYPAIWPRGSYDPAGIVKSDHNPVDVKVDVKSYHNPVDVKSDRNPADVKADDKPDVKLDHKPADVKSHHNPADV